MIDAILSFHRNGHTCGVAKWAARLAHELGVPWLSLDRHQVSHPLVAIMDCEDPQLWPDMIAAYYGTYDLFLHDVPDCDRPRGRWTAGLSMTDARRVYAANDEIAARLRARRPDIIPAWCPSTIAGNPTRGAINVLTFGMAHKIQTDRYVTLKRLLDATGQDYTVSVSTAVHEGTPWDLTATVPDKLRAIFGERLRSLGYLADDALAKELRDCTAVALFYDPALRANNTTAWAVVDAGQPLITNLDHFSPGVICTNIDTVTAWPETFLTGRSLATWPELLAHLRQRAPVTV